MNQCIQCGNSLKPNARFCGKCGAVVSHTPVQPKPVTDTSLKCTTCGTIVSSGFKFCTVCGAATGMAVPASAAPTAFVPPASPKKTVAVEAKPKKRRKIGIVLVFSIVFLLLVGAAGWWYFMGFTPTPSEEDIQLPEYTSHAPVSGTTTTETTEVDVKPGEITTMKLADSSGISLYGITDNAHAKLTKETNTLKLAKTGVETCGYCLELTLSGSDSVAYAKPVITFNRSQVGDINPATINIVRVSDKLDSTGNLLKDQVDFLPVTKDAAGNYTALDYLIPITAFKANGSATSQSFLQGLSSVFIPQAIAQQSKYFSEMPWIANVKYSIVTFQGDVNWARNPILVQMTPDTRKPYWRRPATKKEYTERKNPVVNIIVLVHGHNEQEKGGLDKPNSGIVQKIGETIDDAYKYLGWSNYDNTQTNGIWQYSYKRDVWNDMYKFYIEGQKKAATADPNKPDTCTLFYEFIYPSYRPIFTPVPINSICAHQTLGEALGKALNQELLEKNTLVAEMVKKNLPFNIFFVGHSMGGLVARAGLRSLNNKLQNNVKRLITWGTPHQGSPVTTLRYIIAAGFDVSIDGMPFYPIGEDPVALMEWLAMDTPGTRDLRWSNGSKGFEKFFNYDTYFRGNSKTKLLNPEEYDLRTGSMFYNQNLTTFNESEKFADRFTFLTGNTSKIAQVKKCNYLFTKAYYLLVKASDCAKGSYIINLLAGDDSYKANDGASPVYGQGGSGLWRRPRSVDMGDMDHEEFYGAKGWETADRTYWEINKSAACNCPYIDAFKIDNNKLTAKIIIPSNQKSGDAVKSITMIIVDKHTKKVLKETDNLKIEKETGVISGTFDPPDDLQGRDPELSLTVMLKDNTLVYYRSPFANVSSKKEYNRIDVSVSLQGNNQVETNYDGAGFKVEDTDNGQTTLGFGFSNENQFNAEWGKIPGLTWQGNQFTLSYKYQVKLYENEVRWDSYQIKGRLSNSSPQTLSAELAYISEVTKPSIPNAEPYKTEKKLSLKDVPFSLSDGNRIVFYIKSDTKEIHKHIENYKESTVSTTSKFYTHNIQWDLGGEIVVSFYNRP